MMEDVKEILVFSGLFLKTFIKNIILYFMIFLVVIALTLAVFYLNYRMLRSNLIIYFFIFLLIVVGYEVKKSFHFKKQLLFNIYFLKYQNSTKTLDTPEILRKEIAGTFSSDDLKKALKTTKKKLKEIGLRIFTRKLLLAFMTLSLVPGNSKKVKWEILLKIHHLIRKHFILETAIFCLLFIPFGVISFLLSLGLRPGLKLLIFLLGFLFVYFLKSALFEPITFLLFQKKVYELYRD